VSIRLRVVLATVLLAALAVGAADVATSLVLGRYVHRREATQVREIAQGVRAAVASGGRLNLPSLPGPTQPVLVEVLSRNGHVLERVAGKGASQVRLPADLRSHLDQPRQLSSRSGGPAAFDALALPVPGGRTVVAVISIRDDVHTLARLAVVELVAGVVVLVLLALAAAAVVTVSLRPLRRIAATADAIADGDLAARVPPAPRRSEVGRVASALNRMLGEIEAAFAQRDETEARLRRFLSDASHELRTPLTSIQGYAELFRRGAQERPQDLAKAMGAIEQEAERMATLVEDLLLLARLDETRPLEQQPVALDQLVEAAVESARAVEPDRPLLLDLPERPLVVTGDATRLRQVIDNLLTNIRRHTPAGTAASVALRTLDGQAVLTVEDSGPGIPEAERERVFDRFVRLDPARTRTSGGAGLGLAVVRSIVAAHGGSVRYRPASPHGSIFEVTLPTNRAAPLG
jgi:two-component system, OmpR family, sensor kinase